MEPSQLDSTAKKTATNRVHWNGISSDYFHLKSVSQLQVRLSEGMFQSSEHSTLEWYKTKMNYSIFEK